ncbi:MAG: HAD-IA family hydrolase [Dermatophilus congolensis]|nr:HAD-IA family hydrolase [Dermatophilus congolensis]
MADNRFAAVLVDADGIIQSVEGTWVERLARFAPDDAEGFIRELFDAEAGPLSGEGEWLDQILGVLRRRGIPEVYAGDVIVPWAIIDRFHDCLDVVREVAASTPCHLATNQTRFRADIMRGFGYEQVFETLQFSYELGAHKPDPVYFERVLERLGIGGDQAFFIDDKSENVEAARTVGITAAHHDPRDGAEGLRRIFTAAGLL